MHVERSVRTGISEPGNASFKKAPVLGDGYCFWHAVLRCTFPEEYDVPRVKSSGGPQSRERLQVEIDKAKCLCKELFAKTKLPFEPPQVPLPLADRVLRALGTRFRITVCKEATFSAKTYR